MSRYHCEVCEYVYDEAAGDPREGFPAGTRWADVPADWACPDCGVREKVDFIPEDVIQGASAAPDGGSDSPGGTAEPSERDLGLTDG